MNTCGGPCGISVFNNDHSLGTFTIKRSYWQPRGMPLYSQSDGEHVMQPVKESWENFDPKEFEETVCAGGANGVSSMAPEHMLGNGVMTFGRGKESDKPDEENLADKSPVMESWADYKPENKLNEQDQQVPAVQQPAQPAAAQPAPAQPQAQQNTQAAPQQQAQPVVQQQAQQPQQAAAPVQPQAQVQQPINTQPQAAAPQSQIVNNPQQSTVQESWEGFDMESFKEAHYDPADYWDEDPNWDIPPAGAKMVDCDRELCRRHYNARMRRSSDHQVHSSSYIREPPKYWSEEQKTEYYNAEGTKIEKAAARKSFWADAKNNTVNIEAFHKAYDEELKDKFDFSTLFNDAGLLASKGTYGKIKDACTADPESWALKSLKKLWALQFAKKESTSWENFDMEEFNESIALPGGMLNAEVTEYEKELDKHNQARKNNKVDNPESIGDPDCGEIGVHEFKDSGAPTDVKEKVKTDIKATELKPNTKAVEVDQKKPLKHWDD